MQARSVDTAGHLHNDCCAAPVGLFSCRLCAGRLQPPPTSRWNVTHIYSTHICPASDHRYLGKSARAHLSCSVCHNCESRPSSPTCVMLSGLFYNTQTAVCQVAGSNQGCCFSNHIAARAILPCTLSKSYASPAGCCMLFVSRVWRFACTPVRFVILYTSYVVTYCCKSWLNLQRVPRL